MGSLMTVYSCTGITVDRLEVMPVHILIDYILESVKYLGLDKNKKK